MSQSNAASAVFINILNVIDTEYVKAHYSNPSKDPNNPTGIDHNSEFMIVTGARSIISGQGGPVLNFGANPGDEVSFRAVSIYDNSDDAVIVYGIKPFGGSSNLFNTFVSDVVTLTAAIVPDTSKINGIPATTQAINFTSLDSKVRGKGTENFVVQFGLYTLGKDGETQSLFGYFSWDPTITVS